MFNDKNTLKALLYCVQLLFFVFAANAAAKDFAASSCSADDLESAIYDAISTGGGTVTIPACSENDWGDDNITIDTDTPLRIIGAGIDVTNFACSANAMFIIRGDGLVEIGGFSVDLKGTGNIIVSLNAPKKTTRTWVHHIKALNSDTSPFKICHSAYAKTVLSQLDIRHSDTYGIYVYGPGHLQDQTSPEADWGDNITGVCVIEDSYFYQNGGHVISGFTGSRVIVRYNTFDDMLDTGLDGHGWGYGQSCGLSDTDPRYHGNNWGAYQWEIYNNLWVNTSAKYCMRVRSGTAMVTDNACDADETVRLAIESKYNAGYDPDEVIGPDSKNYTCIEPHIATVDNRPVSGANWQKYWKQGGVDGNSWNSGETYYPFFSSRSDCRFSADIFKDFWDVIQGDTEIYGADGKLIKSPCAYNMPHQWWIWNNTSSGKLFNEEDGPGCITEGITYWLRAPQPGDPVETYTKGTCPDPLTGLTGACGEGAGRAFYNVGEEPSQPNPGPDDGPAPSPDNGSSPPPDSGASPSPDNGASPSPDNGASPSPDNGASSPSVGQGACFIKTAYAMEVDDLDGSRRIDWTRAGYQGTIPHITTNLTDVTDWGAVGDGATDDSGAIQSAIDNTAAPAVIYLPTGTFRIGSRISLKSGMVIRGDGHTASVLECRSGDGCISVRGTTGGGYVPLRSGATKGATDIVVTDVSGFKVGQGGQIRQDDIVTAQADWGRGAVGQMVTVQAINGNTLTVDPPLHLDFPAGRNPEIRPIRYIEQVGLEDLAIKRIDSGSRSGNNLGFRYAANCWVRRVESQWTEKYHIAASESLHLEIRDAYIHDAKSRGSGGYGYGVSLARHATSILVENNIFYDLRHSMIIQLGANGCVFGYNYSERNYSDDDGGWAKTHISLHGHYPFMNLFEGNIVAWAGVGDYWGPIGPGNTLFRNRIQGTDRFDGIGDRHGLSVGYIHGSQNIIGNEVTGGSIYTSASISHPDVHYPDEWVNVLYHGNNEKGEVTWDNAMPDQALPASFYRQAKPVFMGDLPWPALGGDLVLNQGTIPAKQRFDSGKLIPLPSGSDPGPNPAPGPDPVSGPDPEPEPDPISGLSPSEATGSGCFLGTTSR